MRELWELDREIFRSFHEFFRHEPFKLFFGLISMSGVGHVHIAPLLIIWSAARKSKVFSLTFGALLAGTVAYLGYIDDALVLQLVAFGIFTWCCRGLSIEAAKKAILAFIISGLGHILVKSIIPRERPSNFEWAIPMENVYSTRSFPSGHTSTAFAIGLVLFLTLEHRTWAWIALIWGFLVGISRMVVGVHFPSDVLGGLGIGMISAASAILISDAWSGRKGLKRSEIS